jgi:hypothetical protein
MSSGPPYFLAILFGLLISATLHLLLVWPSQEPEDEEEEGQA